MNPLYKTTVTTKGGRAGHAKSDDGLLELDLSLPKALGGTGEGTNPEQLFAAGFGACFEMAVRETAKSQNKVVTDSTVTSEVTLNALDDGSFRISVKMAVSLQGLDKKETEELVNAAQRVCPYSNAIRGNVEVEYEVV
ncbi:MAG: osmotically inducible protein OsmC [Rhodothermales bacterium]|jgi:osmotically inducible protein OsmC